MSRPLSRNERVAQMNKQEELIAKKRQEILEKQKTYELGQAVAAAQSGLSPKSKKKETSKPIGGGTIKTNLPPTTAVDLLDPNTKLQNTFCNDGSFLTHFKKILDAVKKETIVEEIIETPKTSPNSENKSENNETPSQPESSLPTETPSQPVSLPTNTQPIAVPLVYNTTNTASIPNIPPPIIAQLSHLPPPQPQMSCNPNVSTTFFNPPPFTHHSFTTISTPPPPPPPSTPLYLIPPPEPLQLNKIPQPRELDLNAIPKPELNLDAIQIPDHQLQVFSDNNEQFLPTTLESLVELVAENGDAYEDQIRSRKNDVHPSLWFLFDPDSMMYINYRKLLASYRQGQIQNQIRQNQNRMGDENRIKSEPSDDKYDPESVIEYHEDSDDEYMKDMMGKNLNNLKRKMEIKTESDYSDDEQELDSKQQLIQQRKRKSRWGGKVESTASIIAASNPITAIVQTNFANQNKPLLSAIQRTDPALLQYARQNYGTTNLTEDDWRKCEEHFKVNLLYQDMMRKRKEIDQLAKSGKFKYEYDSDEDIRGGTWEHKLRTAEMEATQAWADALTEQSEGKHHIGDFLPPEELKKFMEKYDAKKNNRQPDLSDYKEYKLREDNIGFQMLQKLGWKEGQGLGAGGAGIIDPVNKAPQRDANQGLGAGTPSTPEDCDNEYEAYRKRMMLAYRFRPNPLNNPRRAYY